jgi:hypothetical protein
MKCKILAVLAATAAIAIAQLPTDAVAKSFSHGSHASFSQSSKSFSTSSAIRSPSTAGVNFARSGTWSGSWRGHGFRHFRHNRFFVGAPFAYAAYDSCYRWRHVWTRWGWKLRRVYVCDYPYVY